VEVVREFQFKAFIEEPSDGVVELGGVKIRQQLN
jgi:hypothetical protein